ncbi:hypothetical protein HII36_46125 [Nonomuraea sp. NN258]|uniref:hypothetical protein n=1 Tax=Nonomuraea antri TaxID=2730852 RepID=UPI001569677D|nr:hypothetical protein [Nonomuraea antri]NRQ39153.1 hypothetical protein [Nonomuraea antri]
MSERPDPAHTSGARDIGGNKPLPPHRALIHQAAGALSYRLGGSVDDALARLCQ